MKEEKIQIPRRCKNEDNQFLTLSAIYYTIEANIEKTPLIIMCHGFSGDKYEWDRFPKSAQALNQAGFDTIIFDFSGSGENLREPVTLTKQVHDLEDVYAWAKSIGYKIIGTIGLSFGGITSLNANLPDRFAAVFWAPAFYMDRVMGSGLFKISRWIGRHRKKPLKIHSSGKNGAIHIDKTFVEDIENANSNEKLSSFSIPSLIIQGLSDKTVRPKLTKEAYSRFPQDEDHKLVEIAGTGHNFNGDYLNQFIHETINWFKKYLPL